MTKEFDTKNEEEEKEESTKKKKKFDVNTIELIYRVT